MKNFTFQEKLNKRWGEKRYICVGLDTAYEKLPVQFKNLAPHEAVLAFNKIIIDTTQDLVSAFKPNSAYYEALGDKGFETLKETVLYAKTKYPMIPFILDAKRADIGSTNEKYCEAIFDYLAFDAVTVNPYLGAEAIQPFLLRKDKGIILLVKTSNPGSGELQDLLVGEKEPLWHVVAKKVATEWNTYQNCGIVVGATYPKDLHEVRTIVSDMPILLPGIGAQGGDIAESVAAGKGKDSFGLIINAARSVLYASNSNDFAEKARAEVERLTTLVENTL